MVLGVNLVGLLAQLENVTIVLGQNRKELVPVISIVEASGILDHGDLVMMVARMMDKQCRKEK